MKIIARVLKTGPIAKQSEKDQKKGLRFLTVVREEISKTIGEKTYGEFLIYSIKTTDEPEIGLARRSVEIRRLSGGFVHATSSVDSSLSI